MEQAVNRFPLTRILLRFTLWLERKMHKQEDFSLNDPEWNELQNKVNAMKRDMNKVIRSEESDRA